MRTTLLVLGGLLALGIGVQCQRSVAVTREKERMMQERKTAKRLEKATFAAGCFWGVEAEFRRQKGVTNTQVGYSGGTRKDPTYEDVCTGTTGHAESVEVEFDPEVVSYDRLLDLFFELHDPTSRDRQGPDVGSQYRSAIFAHGEEQFRAAQAAKERLEKSGKYRRPIATQIALAAPFYRAEEYHQQYHEKHGFEACRIR